MPPIRLAALRSLAAAALIVSCAGASHAQEFPMGQVLVLDAPRIGPLKRVPSATIEDNGRATLDLWCKTVPALFEVSGPQIRIQAAPLPEALPLYMSTGQCSPERMQADADFLVALTNATEWQRQGDRIALSGPAGGAPLIFRLSSH